MNVQVPDPLRDAAGFHAWSLMYLERTLSADDERAFEKLLVSSNDAAVAFARAAQLDTDLHECLEGAPAIARIPAAPANAEILDPRNVADMRFVNEQIRVSAESQARDKNVSQRVMAVRRSRRYWLPGLAAAGVAAAVAAFAIHSYSSSGTIPAPGPSPIAINNNKNRNEALKEVVRPVEKPANVNSDGNVVVAERLPEPVGVPKKRDNVGEIVDATPPSNDDIRVADGPKKDVDPVPARTNELPPAPNAATPPPAEPAVAIDEADCKRLADNAAWRGIGTLALKRENEKVEIDLKYDGKNPFKIGETLFGGMVYRKPIEPERGVVAFKLAVSSAVLSSPEHDFQFVLNNSRLTDRNNFYLSVKDQIAAVKDRLNVGARQHVFELVVRKHNVFELRIDGIKTHTIALELNRFEWEKIYLGFRTSSRGNDAQPVVVEDVSLKYLEK